MKSQRFTQHVLWIILAVLLLQLAFTAWPPLRTGLSGKLTALIAVYAAVCILLGVAGSAIIEAFRGESRESLEQREDSTEEESDRE